MIHNPEKSWSTHPLLRKAWAVLVFGFVLMILAAVAYRSTRLVMEMKAGGRAGKYNVLLLTVDSLRADHLGCYGDLDAQTSTMDRLASDGVLFERTETAAPITLPAHASILTGTYPAFHGVRNDEAYRLGPRAETLAETLHGHGYRTGAIVASSLLDLRFGLAQGFDTYDDDLDRDLEAPPRSRQRRAEEVADLAGLWLRENSEDRFFLWLHFFDPHAPYAPPSPFSEQYRASPYDGEIAYVDQQIRRVLDQMEDLGIQDQTLVILVSDHGEGLGEHGEATHGIFLYESTVRVPLILSLPAALPRGKRVDTPVRTIDLLPTILGIVDLPTPEQAQGTNLVPLTSRRPADLLLKSVSETLLPRENHGWSELASIRVGDWKYILAPRPELYDLRVDPLEQKDLSAKRSGELSRFREELERLLSEAGRVGSPLAYRQELDKTARERLRSLGYLWTSGSAPDSPAPDPKDRVEIMALMEEAADLKSRGKLREALAHYDTILEVDPRNWMALRHRGQARLELNDPAGAASDFEIILTDRPRNPQVLTELGRALLQRGSLNEAARTFRQVIGLAPDSDAALAGLGEVLLQQGHHGEATESFQRALHFNPVSHEAQVGLAATLAAEGKDRQAEAAYRRAVEVEPDNPAPALALAKMLQSAGRFDEVIQLMETSLRSGAEKPAVRLALALAHLEKGELSEASEEFNRVLQTNPADSMALIGAARLALEQGNTSRAIDLLERARLADPSNVVIHQRLAQLYDETGRDEDAITEYHAILALDPGARRIHFFLGRTYARQGKTREAASQYRAYLEAGEDAFLEDAREALARLESP